MTDIFLQRISDFYNGEDVIGCLTKFYNEKAEDLQKEIFLHSNNIFFTQPEIFIILERLANKKIHFKAEWSKLYPIEVLETIANAWGTSLE